MEISSGHLDNLEEVATLHEACFDAPWGLAAFRDLLAMNGMVFWVARETAAPKIMGFILVRVAADEAEIITIAVDPAWRGKQIGEALITRAVAEIKVLGVLALILEVAEDNNAALRLYERLGFAVTGRRPAYYERKSGRVAANIMTLMLSQS